MTTYLDQAYLAYRQAAAALVSRPWRQGHQNPCNVYADLGTPDYHEDHAIGHFMTPELAADACESHNRRLANAVVPSVPGACEDDPAMTGVKQKNS